jgi:hypothetical protein
MVVMFLLATVGGLLAYLLVEKPLLSSLGRVRFELLQA